MLSAHWRQSPLVDALLDYTSQRPLGAIGLHFRASLGAMTWRQSPLPSGSTAGLHFPASLGGCELETVSSLWMHCWTPLPSVPWEGLLDYTSQHPLGLWPGDSLLPSGCTAGLHFPASLGGYEAMWQFDPIRCKYKWCRQACLQPILFSLLLVVWDARDCGAEPYAHRSLNAWEGSWLSTAPLALPVVLGREWEISLCCVWTVACFFSYLLLRVRPFQQRKHGEKWEVFLLFWLFTGVQLLYDFVLVWISYAYTCIHSSWDSFPTRG